MTKKTVKAPLSYDPGKGRPKEHLAYLNWQEMQELQRINGGNMERGPRGLPSFPPADARGSSSKASSSSSRGGGPTSRQGSSKASMSSKSTGGGPTSRQGSSKASMPSRPSGGGPQSRQGSSKASMPSRPSGGGGVRSISSGPSARGPVSRIPSYSGPQSGISSLSQPRAPVGSASAAEEMTRRDFVERQLGFLESDPIIKRDLKNAMGRSMWDTRISDAVRAAQGMPTKGAYGEVSPASQLAGFRTLQEQASIPKKNTRVKDPAGSYHTWGLAVDVAPERLPGETQRQYDIRVGEVNREIAKNMSDPNVTWGGSWKNFVDPVHFQYGSGGARVAAQKYGTNVASAGVRPSTMVATAPTKTPISVPTPGVVQRPPVPRLKPERENQVAALAQPAYRPYGMVYPASGQATTVEVAQAPSQAGLTKEDEKVIKQELKPAKTAIRGAGFLTGLGLGAPVGLGSGLAYRGYEKSVINKLDAYKAATPAERDAMERKDPSIIAWAPSIGIQPQNDISMYNSWAAERGLRGPGESSGGQPRDVQYAGGIGSLPSGTTAMSGTPSTPSTTTTPSGVRPYEYYQWDVGVNIPSQTDPNYTNYQEYLRRRAAAQTT